MNLLCIAVAEVDGGGRVDWTPELIDGLPLSDRVEVLHDVAGRIDDGDVATHAARRRVRQSVDLLAVRLVVARRGLDHGRPGKRRARVDADHEHGDERTSKDRRRLGKVRVGAQEPDAGHEARPLRWIELHLGQAGPVLRGIEPVDRGIVLVDEADVAEEQILERTVRVRDLGEEAVDLRLKGRLGSRRVQRELGGVVVDLPPMLARVVHLHPVVDGMRTRAAPSWHAPPSFAVPGPESGLWSGAGCCRPPCSACRPEPSPRAGTRAWSRLRSWRAGCPAPTDPESCSSRGA